MTTQKWWWPTVALMVVLLSTVVGSASKGPCPTGHLVIAANEMKQLPASINNKAGPPIVSCYGCAYMVMSANTQTQIIFHCFHELIKLVRPMFPTEDRKRDGKYHFFWKDLPSEGESVSVRREISPSMTFKDALEEHEKIFPPSNASTVSGFHFHCFHGKFKAKFLRYQMILGFLHPMHIQSVKDKMKCFIKVVGVKARKGWPFHVSTIEYGSVEGRLCPKTRCEQNEYGMSAMCCCHGSGCNNAPLIDAVNGAASAHRRVTATPTAPPKITAAFTTTTTTPETTTASETTVPTTSTTTTAPTTSRTTTAPEMTKPSTPIFEDDTVETTTTTTSATTTISSVTTAGENAAILWAALITISVLLLVALIALVVVICIMLRRQKVANKKISDDSPSPVVVLGRSDKSLLLSKRSASDDEKSATNSLTTNSLTTTDDAPKSKAYTS